MSKILSFIFMLILSFTSVFAVPLKNYESKELFSDADFKNGFSVVSQGDGYVKLGDFKYNNNENSPLWCIAQWGSKSCLWENRVESDPYTITDGVTKWVTYNPDEKSVKMRLNAQNVYNGEPADVSLWPHLLLEQSPFCDYQSLTDEEKAFYCCSSDNMVLNLKIKLSDFVDTTNKEGINAVEYLAYFYLSGVDGSKFIWFGVNLFDSRGYRDTYWALDESSGQMIYSLSTKDTYGLKSKSLYRNGKPYVSDEWVNIQIDLKPHIENALERANKSNTFGKTVGVEDFYLSGTNIGFEIHGNYDCTVEIKDFNITSYNKKS